MLREMPGESRTYNFTISRGYIAPDGVNRSVLLVNNQFPGVGVAKKIKSIAFANLFKAYA